MKITRIRIFKTDLPYVGGAYAWGAGNAITPEEVAEAVWFLAVEAAFMTGAVLRLDGGFVLGGDRVPAMPPGIL